MTPSRTARSRPGHVLSALLVLGPCLVAMVPASVIARDLHVSSLTGDDDNPGTEAEPFRTLQHCIDQWDGVTAMTCHGAGTFHEELVVAQGGPSAADRNRLIAWDVDGDGELGDETFVLDGQGTRNIGIEVRSGTHAVEIGWLTIRNYEPDGGCGDGGELHHVSFDCFGGCSDWWIHDCTFERLGVSCDASGSYISIKPRGVPRLLLERSTFREIGGYTLRYFAGNGITIRDNYFDIVATGIKVWDVQPSLDGDGIEDLLVERNVFACDGNGVNDPTRPADDCGPQSGIGLSNDCINAVIRDNQFTDCVVGVALGTDDRFGKVPLTGILVERNHHVISAAACNPWSGQFLSLNDCGGLSGINGQPIWVQDVVIRNNVIQKLGGGITQSGLYFRAGHPFAFSSDIVVENNTIRGYDEGIRTGDCGDYTDQLDGVTVRNNVFADIDDKYYGHWGSAYPTNWVSDSNTFEPGTRVGFEWGPKVDLSAWTTRTGQDAASVACVPTFAGPTDHRLDATDACARDRGLTLAAFADDFERKPRPRGLAWDVGADEYWPELAVSLRVSASERAPSLWLADPPAELPAVRYYRGELRSLLVEYTHSSPFTGVVGAPECRAEPGVSIPDPAAAGDGVAWYYLAVPLVGEWEGSFGVDSTGSRRPQPGDSLRDRVTSLCP